MLDFVEEGSPLGFRISDLRDVHLHVENAVRPESEVGVFGLSQAAHEQAARNEQHEAHGHLHDDERSPTPMAACDGDRVLSIVVQSVVEIGTRRAASRNQADDQRRRPPLMP